MNPRANASQVGDDHMRSAVTAGRAPSVISSFGNDDTALHIPQMPTRTPAQKAAAERQEAAIALGASRWVADYGMVRRHGCTGLRCRKRAHKGDLEVMRELLEMLGLREEAPRAKSAARRFER